MKFALLIRYNSHLHKFVFGANLLLVFIDEKSTYLQKIPMSFWVGTKLIRSLFLKFRRFFNKRRDFYDDDDDDNDDVHGKQTFLFIFQSFTVQIVLGKIETRRLFKIRCPIFFAFHVESKFSKCDFLTKRRVRLVVPSFGQRWTWRCHIATRYSFSPR